MRCSSSSRMPSLTPVFLFFLLNVRYTWHRIHHVRVLPSGIPEQINLALECLIPTCVPPEYGNFAEYPEFWKMRTGINRNTGRNAQPSGWQGIAQCSMPQLPCEVWAAVRVLPRARQILHQAFESFGLDINYSRGAVCVVWEFAPVQTYACVGLNLISTVT